MRELIKIKSLLQTLKPALSEKYNVSESGLFGSVVRDDFNDKSDVDIIIDFSKPIGIEFIDIANLIENKLNRKVDLVSKKGIKQKYMQAIESEILYI